MIEQERTDIDKGEVNPESLIELYINFGLFPKHQKNPEISLEKAQDRHGDIRNELLYLLDHGAIKIENERISLKSSEVEVAEKIADKTIYSNSEEEINDIMGKAWIPEYLSEPEIVEEYAPVLEEIDQEPNREISTRIIEILEDRNLKPRQVEKELSAYANFGLERSIRYLETLDVLERTENNRYTVAEEIPDELTDQKLNVKGRIKQEERHKNDPWKP